VAKGTVKVEVLLAAFMAEAAEELGAAILAAAAGRGGGRIAHTAIRADLGQKKRALCLKMGRPTGLEPSRHLEAKSLENVDLVEG